MKKTCLLFFQAILLVSVSTLQGQTLTLDECVELGLRDNPALKSAELMVDWSEQERKSARGAFLPSLSVDSSLSKLTSMSATGPTQADYLDQNIYGYSARLSQILYAGSRLFNTYTKATLQKEMYQAEKQFVRLETIYKIESAFFQLMKAEHDVAASVDTVKRLKSNLKAAEAFYKSEMAPYVQVLQARVDLADAEQSLSITRNNVDKKRADVFVLLDMQFNPEIKFTGGLKHYSSGYYTTEDQCWETASRNREDLKSLAKQILMSEKDVAIAMGRYLPVIRLEAGYYDQTNDYQHPVISFGESYDRDQMNKYWKAGAVMSWQLFDGGSAWYGKEKHLIEIKRLKTRITDTENRIKSSIRTAIFSLFEAEQRIKDAFSAIEAAKEYYEREVKRLQAGVGTIPSVLDAQARLTRAEGNYSQALFDYQLSRAGINFLIGVTDR